MELFTSKARWPAKMITLATLSILGAMLCNTALAQGADTERGAMGPLPENLGEMGTYQLIRSRAGVAANVQARKLDPGFAYTAWIVVFPDPSLCSEPCGPNDEPSSGFAEKLGGAIAGNSGRLNFASGVTGFDGTEAEIHLVVISHGEAIPGMIPEMISTPGGGCGINVCTTPLLAVLSPVLSP